jgi:hypothetical protein
VPASRRGYEVEPSATRDVHRPNLLLAAWQADRLATIGAAGLGFAVSGDGGRSWSPPVFIGAGCTHALTDPTVVLAGNRGYLAYFSAPRNERGAAAIGVATIDTDRRRVLRRVVVDHFDTVDKPALAIDPDVATNLYLAWIRRRGGEFGRSLLMFSASSDGGRHWRKPRVLDGRIPVDAQGTQVLAFSDASLLVAYSAVRGDGRAAQIVAFEGRNNGDSWSRRKFIGEVHGYRVRRGKTGLRTADFIPALAGTPGGVVALATQRNRAGHGTVLLSQSDGFREPYSAAAQVATAAGQVFTPSIAFTRASERAVTYYVLRGNSLTAWFKRPGGDPMRLAGPVSIESVPQRDRFLGDYESLVATQDAFVPVFVMPDGGAGGPTRVVAGRVLLNRAP